MENENDLVVFDYYESPMEANIVKGVLETNGVPSMITDQLLSSSIFPLTATIMGEVKLMVFRKDLELASEIMNSAPIKEADEQEEEQEEENL